MTSTTERQPSGRRRARPGSRHARRRRGAPTGGDVVRGTFRTIGELLFTAGVVMLFFAAYQVYGKQAQTDNEQSRLDQAVAEQWEAGAQGPDSEPLPGTANSRLYIPKLDQKWVVVNGVGPEDIRYGPGHYPGTAEAGQVGNYSVAGHRVAAVFWDLDLLGDGDEIVLEDRDNFYTYRVIETEVVTPDQVRVVAPDPFDPEAEPTRSLLTLTTCHPKLQNAHRLVIHAELSETRPKSDGMPENIADMAPEQAE
ncbi:class E sortase [Marinitenerispora sediminis]|uniref:Class E sortase n=1 Tax=Marinitenerispora sediminis TaxID=1931232 RepID=A0A368T8Z4_9ACTN|nr:class E sortase [Marinitenerispora sediminis]RCV53255.1 class E sortase [Marinitenerispora sediminis]RCV56136.1 class E sortase [Marinitenerispora sediminis]RCV60867.1 class E sortase [Marinitenerispora sediminis]